MSFTENYDIIIAVIVFVAVIFAIVLSGKLKISLSDSRLSIASEKSTRTNIKGISSSTVEVCKKAGDDTSVEDVRDNSNITVK